MYLDANEILLGCGSGHLQSGVAHTEADLEGARRTTAEYLIEIAQAIFQLQAEQRPALVDAALLAFSHAPGAHHEALDGTALATVFGQFGLLGIGHAGLLSSVLRLCGLKPCLQRSRADAQQIVILS